MARRTNWRIVLGLSLGALSALLYFLHYGIFRDSRHIFIYLLGDIAFLPIQVLFVTLIIDGLLSERERQNLLHKMNMVIGAFFSEVGRELLSRLHGFDQEPQKITGELARVEDWPEKGFPQASQRLKGYGYQTDSQKGDLAALQEFLVVRRSFLLGLLENPNLLEHEGFTELLWAVFHLAEELAFREDVGKLPQADYAHLSGDMKRAYTLLVLEWLQYLQHLRVSYPYLFSLAVRTNPFDPQASPIVA